MSQRAGTFDIRVVTSSRSPRSRPGRAGSPSLVDESWGDGALLNDRTDPGRSFAVFYRRHVEAVIRFAASRGLDADEAADVVSDTFMAALKARDRYRPEGATARLWLLSIAARRIADVHRQRGRERRRLQRLRTEAVVLTQDDRDSYSDLLEGSRHGLDALADLPPLQQRAVRARVVEQREYAEIAEALDLTQEAARQHVSRGLSRLRTAIKDRT